MATEQLLYVTLSIIIGTLGAIVYALRVLVLMERRVARIELARRYVTAGEPSEKEKSDE